MGHLADAFRSIVTVAKSFARPTQTVQFPKEIRPRAERYRASFALLHEENGDEACIGCLQCERICPSKVIAIKGPAKRDSPVTGKKRSYADDFTLDMSACIFCELCVQVCPADAIVMTREPEVPGFEREDLVLTMPRLYANEKNKQRSWGDGTRLMEMQRVPLAPNGGEGQGEGPNLPQPLAAASAQPPPPATAVAGSVTPHPNPLPSGGEGGAGRS